MTAIGIALLLLFGAANQRAVRRGAGGYVGLNKAASWVSVLQCADCC